ncbi:MAG TPA: rhomboid family intramembrane serine protease [Bacteroidetes bacterium]|nr:rhomboid family intramembrane serine protease [Bacteroidota bacterium]
MYQQDSFASSFRRSFNMLPGALRWILAINVIVFVIQALLDLFGLNVVNRFIIEWFALSSSSGEMLTQPWRLVTYMFLHGSGFHILFNMLWLWWMGRPVEDSLGSRNFAVLFLGSGIGGALIQILLSGVIATGPTIGASGAVFGIMVCFAIMYPTQPILLLLLPPIEARYFVAGLIFLDVLFLNAGDNIARLVHLGGAFWGWILIKAYYRGYNYDAWIGSAKQSITGVFSSSGPTKRTKNKNMYSVSDANIIEEIDQNEMDRILDKIAKSGYSSLTADEKRLLFELSNKKN